MGVSTVYGGEHDSRPLGEEDTAMVVLNIDHSSLWFLGGADPRFSNGRAPSLR
jgi:hypothetical protein